MVFGPISKRTPLASEDKGDEGQRHVMSTDVSTRQYLKYNIMCDT